MLTVRLCTDLENGSVLGNVIDVGDTSSWPLALGVGVDVGVAVGLAADVDVGVGLGVAVDVAVGVGVFVGVGVGVAVTFACVKAATNVAISGEPQPLAWS